MNTPPAPWDDQQGSGTVVVVGIIGCLATLLLGGLMLVQATVASSRAAAVADLAALAAADAARSLIPSEPCQIAEQTATRHHVRVESCQWESDDTVRVSVTNELVAGSGTLGLVATAESRAGPDRMMAGTATDE
ncbi:Rv3654c family TadE-like protein [Auritidibacter ignavus]|uniref:Rv3654c family TadE-like protein n=1 Tax=Auritidibacter ignavus TaxID=678932 RepID=UPI00109C89C8|nr:Rv3654c family TadE-like protein [Auritidibacter ignavus]